MLVRRRDHRECPLVWPLRFLKVYADPRLYRGRRQHLRTGFAMFHLHKPQCSHLLHAHQSKNEVAWIESIECVIKPFCKI